MIHHTQHRIHAAEYADIICGWFLGLTCFVMFYVLKRLNMLRVEADLEFKGKFNFIRRQT